MFKRIVFSACVSGLIAGLLITVAQMWTVIPMILEAETYEVSAPVHQDTGHAHDAGETEWAPEAGMERSFYTAVTNTLAAIGFALLLAACYSLQDKINWRKGLVWGLGGFIAFQFAPALGLPPELPGTVAAEASSRQVWWVVTALITAAGLGMMVFASMNTIKIIGVLLILLPHVIGAPQPFIHATVVPQSLAADFIIKTLFVGGTFWILLGGLTGYTFNKFR